MLVPILAELVSTRDKAETVRGRERQKVRQSVHSDSDEASQHDLSHSPQTHEGHREGAREMDTGKLHQMLILLSVGGVNY